MNVLRRALAPLSLGLLTTALTGCFSGYTADQYDSYSSRIWGADPYCLSQQSYGYDRGYQDPRYPRDSYLGEPNQGEFLGLGCDLSQRDTGVMQDMYYYRHGRSWQSEGEGYGVVAAAKGHASWQKEFRLSGAAVSKIKMAFGAATRGDASKLAALGVSAADASRLGDLQMPGGASLARAAATLKVSRADLHDLLALFLMRLRTAMTSGR